MSNLHYCCYIEYMDQDGQPVGSDLCFDNAITDEHRKVLHDALDEAIDSKDPYARFVFNKPD